MSRRAQWSAGACLTNSSRNCSHCNLPQRIVSQLHHSSSQGSSTLVVVELKYEAPGGGEEKVVVAWSGEVSRQHTDLVEVPREYAEANGFAVTSPSSVLFPVTVSQVESTSLLHLESAELAPSSSKDWDTVFTHKAVIEDTLLQKLSILHVGQRVCVPVIPGLVANLTVKKVCPELASSHEPGDEGDQIKETFNSRGDQGRSWLNGIYEHFCTAAADLDRFCNDVNSATSTTHSEKDEIIGVLTAKTMLTILQPADSITSPATPLNDVEDSGKQSFNPKISGANLCDLIRDKPLRLLPVHAQLQDTSYFGFQLTHKEPCVGEGYHTRTPIGDTEEDVLKSFCNAEEVLFGDIKQAAKIDPIANFNKEYVDSICTCVVHPLLFIEAQEMAKRELVRLHSCCSLTSEGDEALSAVLSCHGMDESWKDMALASGGYSRSLPVWYLGYIYKTEQSEGLFMQGAANLLPHKTSSMDSPANDDYDGIQKISVRVIVSAAVRPHHIFVSTPLRHALALSDFDTVNISILSGDCYKPCHPNAVRYRIRLVSQSLETATTGHNAVTLDDFRIALLGLQSSNWPDEPSIIPSGTFLRAKKCEKGVEEVHGRYVICFGNEDDENNCPPPYLHLKSSDDFFTFVNNCCAAFETTHEPCQARAPSSVNFDTISPSRRSGVVTAIPKPGDNIDIPVAELFGVDEVVCSVTADALSHFLPCAAIQRVTFPLLLENAKLDDVAKGIPAPLGSILVGESGVGKTSILRGIARSLNKSPRTLVNHVHVSCKSDELLNTMEYRAPLSSVTTKLKQIFDDAFDRAPSIICFDDIDYLCPNLMEKTDDRDSDPFLVVRNEKICDLLLELLEVTKQNNELCSFNAEEIYTNMSRICTDKENLIFDCKEFSSNKEKVSSQDCSSDCSQHLVPVVYAAHQVVGRCLSKSVYVLASATSSKTVHRRLTDITSLGRRIVSCPATLPSSARVSILRNALSRLGWPLTIDNKSTSRAAKFLQHAKQNDLTIQRLTEGYRACDLWSFARRIASACFVNHTKSVECEFQPRHSDISDVIECSSSFVPRSDIDAKVSQEDKYLSWNNVGGYDHIKNTLFDTFRRPILLRKLYTHNKIKFPRGVMLFGPPGTGKTVLAKAAGPELGLATFNVRGPELLSKYIGESEKAVRSLFEKAKAIRRPCVIIFDEFEALAPKRGTDNAGGVTDRVVNQLLTYLDGVENTLGNNDLTGSQIFIIVATSRPDMIDSALLRPGRISKHLYVGLPDLDTRRKILKCRLCDICLADTRDDNVEDTLEQLLRSPEAESMTGADWKGVVDTAFLQASADHVRQLCDTETVKDINSTSTSAKPSKFVNEEFPLTSSHFLSAFEQLQPSLSSDDLRFYNSLHEKFIPTVSDKVMSIRSIKLQKQCFA